MIKPPVSPEIAFVSIDAFRKDRKKALQLIRIGIHGIIAISAFIQLIFHFSVPENLLAVSLVWISSAFTVSYTLESERFHRNPISVLLVLGFNFVSLSGALIAMTMSMHALVDYLMVPRSTFIHLACAQMTLIAAHWLYEKLPIFASISRGIREAVLRPLGAFEIPSNLQLWIMGLIGCTAVLVTRAGSFAQEKIFTGEDVGTKAVASLTFLLAAPFLMPILSRLKQHSDNSRGSYIWPLLAYFAVIVVVGSFANTRSVFADAIATLGLGMMLVFALGRVPVNTSTVTKAAAIALIALLVLPFISRIATAMVLVREARDSVGGMDLFILSVQAFFDDDRIYAYVEDAKVRMLGEYSEFYIDNPLMARLIITKFHDNMFYFAQAYMPADVELLWTHFFARVVAYLPQPLIDFLGLGVDKADYVFSIGDYMFYLSTGYGLGGYRTGSMIAEGFSIAGIAFPVLLCVMAIACFVVYDSFYDLKEKSKNPLSPIILLQIWYLFGGVAGSVFGAEGLSKVIGGIVRGLPQSIIAYVAVIFFVNLFFLNRMRSSVN